MTIIIGEAPELGRCEHTSIKGSAHDIMHHALLEPTVQLMPKHQIKAVVLETAFTIEVLHTIRVSKR